MTRLLVILSLVFPAPTLADSLVATRTIRAQSVLAPTDMALVKAAIPGAMENPDLAIGQEARVTLYAGRAIRSGDLGPPALVNRNQIVTLHFRAGHLGISTEGRALERGGQGDVIRVMNLTSRNTITGRISADGTIHVGSNPNGS
ncbi:MAG: flagellar basal body P-ring formation chaperone FlgA [Pseudorhodobacter sp.]